MSQLPPCSLGGTVRAASMTILFHSALPRLMLPNNAPYYYLFHIYMYLLMLYLSVL